MIHGSESGKQHLVPGDLNTHSFLFIPVTLRAQLNIMG